MTRRINNTPATEPTLWAQSPDRASWVRCRVEGRSLVWLGGAVAEAVPILVRGPDRGRCNALAWAVRRLGYRDVRISVEAEPTPKAEG